MKSLITLLEALLNQFQRSDSVNPSRDLAYALSRIEHEGMSFLTITLPLFAKDFERSLELGEVDSALFAGFRKRGAIPTFLQGMLSRVFEPTGKLLTIPDLECIEGVRQICLAFKKIQLPCTDKRVKEALDQYVKCDQEIPALSEVSTSFMETLQNVADLVWPIVLGEIEQSILSFGLLPKHGPGAVAERTKGQNQKFVWRSWHDRLEGFFPFTEYAVATLTDIDLQMKSVEFLSPDQEPPVRVVHVPKTLKAPRIIAIEPTCMQFAQQSLMQPLYDTLQRHPLTSRSLRFTDQGENQKLAKASSKSREKATMDLSEASDRVSFELVKAIFRKAPVFLDAIDRCRSTSARIEYPDGRETLLVLRKFASMGSGLCFPVEAMVFYSILLAAWHSFHNLPPSWKTVSRASCSISVYGDDIIVPTGMTQVAIDWLEAFGLKVNRNKTFSAGKFRESCGMDAYDGNSVTPTYVRSMPPCSKRDVSELISWISLGNQLYAKGLWLASETVRCLVTKVVRLPYVSENSGALGWHSHLYRYEYTAIHRTLHSPISRLLFVKTKKVTDKIDGYAALLKCVLSLERSSKGSPLEARHLPGDNLSYMEGLSSPKDHLDSSARRGAVTLKSRWAFGG